jgi:hypothetical protein
LLGNNVTIAGHNFEDTSTGRRCISYSSVKGGTCEMAWLHVRSCRIEDIEVTDGFAHHGRLTKTEYAEVRVEVDREVISIWDAVIDASSAGAH